MIDINDIEKVATEVATNIAQPVLRSMYSVSRNQLLDLIKDIYITSFRKGRASSESQIRELQEKLKCAEEALEFYGNEMSYSIDDYHGISGEMRYRIILHSDTTERNDVYQYAGRRAREALKKIRGE